MRVELDRLQFGDFQTPPALARRVVELLRAQGCAPGTVIEPTCGTGAFVAAALALLPDSAVLAYDINPEHLRKAAALERRSPARVTCQIANVFEHDWAATLEPLPEPILLLGNPPWATSSGLSAIGSRNLPQKANFQNRRGLDARTGKSNFDVAESILLTLLQATRRKAVTLAMLVKTTVARRVLAHLWTTGATVEAAAMYRFDSFAYFGVRADACLFICRLGTAAAFDCAVADLDRPAVSTGRIGWRDGVLVSDPVAYDQHKSMIAVSDGAAPFRWRSGVKHDCAAIMELRRAADGTFINGLGHRVRLEPEYVYPLLKGTDLLRERGGDAHRWLVVTQARPGEDTSIIAQRAPETWAYLCSHGARLDARRSSIYRTRPRFSVFGVGPYTFAHWKVAISALRKQLSFAVVGPCHGRPVMLDDTCYHLPCESEADARLVAGILNSDRGRELLGALVFWDSKRPITSGILQRIDLHQLAIHLGLSGQWAGSSLASPGQPAVR